MRILVCYTSRSGFTAKYAHMIADELSCELQEASDTELSKLGRYDLLIYGGCLHAVGITGISLVKEALKQFPQLRLIVFAVGASPVSPSVTRIVEEENFSAEELKRLSFYYFRGGFDHTRLKGADRFLMTLMKWKILLKRERTSDEQGMLKAYREPFDATDPEALGPLLDEARRL